MNCRSSGALRHAWSRKAALASGCNSRASPNNSSADRSGILPIQRGVIGTEVPRDLTWPGTQRGSGSSQGGARTAGANPLAMPEYTTAVVGLKDYGYLDPTFPNLSSRKSLL